MIQEAEKPAAEPAQLALSPRERVGDRAPLLPLAVAITLGKATVLLVIFLAAKLLPFFDAQFLVNFVDPPFQQLSLAAAFSTWDAQHYLYLSENGYQPGQESNAFFPLFPALIHLVTPLAGSSLVAGLVVSNVASLAGLLVLFRFVQDLYGENAAIDTLLLLLALPTAFFFSLVYSESIFLLLAALFFYFLYRNRWGWASLPAALLPLARPAGALVIVPFAAYYLLDYLGLGRGRVTRPAWLSARTLWLFSPFLGIAVYLLVMWLATGNPLELMNAEKGYVSGYSILHVLHPADLWAQLTQGPLHIHGYTDSMIDRAFFCAFLALLIPMFRRLPLPLSLFALATGLLSVLSGTFMSYPRYLMAAFPVFLAVALLLQRRSVRVLWVPLLFLFTMLQSLFLVMHALSYWVA